MIERVIEYSAKHRWIVFGATALLIVWSVVSMRKTPLDAIPDLSDPQVIVFTDWMGRSPDLVEDQVTYPLVRAPPEHARRAHRARLLDVRHELHLRHLRRWHRHLLGAHARARAARARAAQSLPPDVTPLLGPDATGVGWVYQYVLEDTSGQLDLAQLRALQDFTMRPALQAVGRASPRSHRSAASSGSTRSSSTPNGSPRSA